MDEPSQEPSAQPGLAMTLYGLAMLLGGLALFCAAVGWIDVSDSTFNAPRWLVALVALLIAGAGGYLFALPSTTPAQRANLGAALALGFFTVMGACFTWVIVANVAGRGTLAIAGIPIPLPEVAERWMNRLLVGAVALLMNGVALYGWWTLLTGRWRSFVTPSK
ncbi:MAG TPA: hypothetical protein VGT02_08220 [Methylomirabilota bacterium]|nr:hypothetical protein [Methylomirabilota bacterium]